MGIEVFAAGFFVDKSCCVVSLDLQQLQWIQGLTRSYSKMDQNYKETSQSCSTIHLSSVEIRLVCSVQSLLIDDATFRKGSELRRR